MHAVPALVDRSTLVRWRSAVFAIFLVSGLSVATWASRVPDIKTALDVDRTTIGIMLLIGGIASIAGLSISSVVLARLGARRGMLTMLLVFGAGIAVIGLGSDILHSLPVTVVGLALWGFGNGCLDVMMNVEAAAIEKQSNRTLLPLFHAFFSIGTVLGAGLGLLAIWGGIGVAGQLCTVAAIIAVVAIVAVANVPVHAPEDPDPDAARPVWRERLRLALQAWREPRTYALGMIMLGMAFAEGGANDWLPLAVVEGHDGDAALGAGALAVFSTAMTLCRILGGPVVDRIGRVWTLRVLAATAVAGLLLFIYAPGLPWLFVGATLWGAGVSLGFPLGMSAAADDPAKAAARVSATATIGYVAFLAGPPLLGVVSESIGLLNTLLILVALAALSGLFSGAAKPVGDEAR